MTIPVTVAPGIPRPARVRRLVRKRLTENGLTDELLYDEDGDPRLSVNVQRQFRSQISIAVSGVPGYYRAVNAIMYLHYGMAGIKSGTIGHEFGHFWFSLHLYLTQQGNWDPYLSARGLVGHPKLDTSYSWDRDEIAAEDYRLFYGSAQSLKEWPVHAINRELPDPRNVEGLRELFVKWGTERIT